MNSTTPDGDLHPIEASRLQARRERVFLLIAGLFLGSLTMLNILGVTRFLVLFSVDRVDGALQWTWGNWAQTQWGWSFAIAVGVLPYPITFLCTDLISEFYGRKRANWLVIVGLILNLWVLFILFLGGSMAPVPEMDAATGLPAVPTVGEDGKINDPGNFVFYRIQAMAFGAIAASMIAYLAAQLCDVYLFHFWKRLTNGKYLWLRNNGSTLVSQAIDSIAVILITYYYAKALDGPMEGQTEFHYLMTLIVAGYLFKLLAALLDTLPFYAISFWLKRYLRFDPVTETEI